MKRHSPVIESHSFKDKDFVGGHVVIDFINTVTGRNGTPRDWLDGFGSLVDWAGRTNLLPANRCVKLKDLAKKSPAEAAESLNSAREFRELLFNILTKSTVGRTVTSAELQELHSVSCSAFQAHVLQLTGGSIEPVLRGHVALEDIVSALAVHAMNLLKQLQDRRVQVCAGPNCAWLFIDSSKAGRRKWCDMATCGNDAKAKRHYRTKSKQSTANSRMR